MDDELTNKSNSKKVTPIIYQSTSGLKPYHPSCQAIPLIYIALSVTIHVVNKGLE